MSIAAMALVLTGVAAAQEAPPVRVDAPTSAQSDAPRFWVDGDVAYYDTERRDDDRIVHGDSEALIELLRANPQVNVLDLNSDGGAYYESFALARVVIDFELDTRVVGRCSSACAHVFLGGAGRRLSRGGQLGFHRTGWDAADIEEFYGAGRDRHAWGTPFDMAEWIYEDTQLEVFTRLRFMMDRGVDPVFAVESLRETNDEMWFPYRARLLLAGVLTE